MKPFTIKELKNECEKQIKKGNGDKIIMISSDDEGNSYHYLWYSFITAREYTDNLKERGLDFVVDIDGLEEKIASIDDTIILG